MQVPDQNIDHLQYAGVLLMPHPCLHPVQGTILTSQTLEFVVPLLEFHMNRIIENVLFGIYFSIKHYVCEKFLYCYIQQAAISSFPMMINIPLCAYFKYCLPILKLIDIWTVPSCGLLGIKLLWISSHTCFSVILLHVSLLVIF